MLTKLMYHGDELTHKAATIEDNVEAFNAAVKTTDQLVEQSMNECVEALSKLAEELKSLGDSDD